MTVHVIEMLLPTLQHFPILGYWVILALSFWQSTVFIGMVVPGELLFPAIGFLAASGTFDPIDAFWFCFVGALAGYCLSYYLGIRGEGLASRFNRLSPQIEHGKRLLSRYGLWAMIPGRFMTIGALIPFLAGFARLPRLRFLLFAAAGNAVGIGGFLLAGAFAGHAWVGFGLWSGRLLFFAAALALTAAVYWIARTLVVKGAWPLAIVLSSIFRSMGQGALSNPHVESLLKRHPRITRFLAERFDTRRFEGLTLTLLSIGLAYSLVLLGGLVEDLVTADPIVGVDRRLEALLLVFRTPALLAAFVKVTLLGNWQIILGGAVLFSLYLFLVKEKDFLLPFWVSLGGCGFFSTAGKWLLHRQRPFDMTRLMEYSFPSGHSTYTAFFYGFLIYFFARQAKDRTRRINLVFLWAGITAAVAFSRLYLGVHYLSDVLAGMLLGISWLLAGIGLVELKKARKPRDESGGTPIEDKRKQRWGYALLAAFACLYLFVAATYTPPYFREPAPQAPLGVEADPLASFDSGHLPRYTETITGSPQEPLSLMIIVKNEALLVESLKKAGWEKADPVSLRTLAKAFYAALRNRSYPSAPVTPSFWNAAPLDLAFEKETALRSIRQRHHIRLWKTGYRMPGGSLQYVGTASFDKGVKWLHFSHRIDPAIDAEQKTFVEDCLKAGIVSSVKTVPFVAPSMGANFSGDAFFSEGKIAVLEIRD
jgi:membrane protein DedA with SNARE-associated domain/membrane-associated phospholipid phosphatase